MLPLGAMNGSLFSEASVIERNSLHRGPRSEKSHSVILGISGFATEIKNEILGKEKPSRSMSGLEKEADLPGMVQIEKAVDSIVSNDDRSARQMKIYRYKTESNR